MFQIQVIATGALITVAQTPAWIDGVWECGDQRFTDQNKSIYQLPAVPETFPLLTAIGYYNSFALGEAIAIKGSSIPTILEIWARLEMALNNPVPEPIDPNSPPVVGGLTLLSVTNQAPVAGVGIYLPGALIPVLEWAPSTPYAVGDTAVVGNNVYTCMAAGESGATAPSGTGQSITDGAAEWQYTPTPYIQPSRIPQIQAGSQQ